MLQNFGRIESLRNDISSKYSSGAGDYRVKNFVSMIKDHGYRETSTLMNKLSIEQASNEARRRKNLKWRRETTITKIKRQCSS